MADLSFPDLYGVGRLKNLRRRALSSPTFRDADYVRRYVTVRPPTSWDQESAIRPLREDVVRRLDEAARATRMGDKDAAETAWTAAVAAIDALIRTAEQLHGAPISPWA